MPDRSLLGTWVRSFLLEHVVAERNLSRNTQASYRDTLTLLLPFASACCGRRIDRMTVEDLSPEVVRRFLDHLEQDRHCSGTTRNQRLSAINSLARFVGMRSPVHLAWCTELRSIPCKKTSKALIGYLEKTEIDALLRQPDRRDVLGARDHALLLYLYNSGSRADEAARLSIGDLRLAASPAVRILGKGNKLRMCRLWPVTAASLMPRREIRCFHQPAEPTDDAVWHTPRRSTRRHVGQHIGPVLGRQACEPTYHPAHDCGPLAACRR